MEMVARCCNLNLLGWALHVLSHLVGVGSDRDLFTCIFGFLAGSTEADLFESGARVPCVCSARFTNPTDSRLLKFLRPSSRCCDFLTPKSSRIAFRKRLSLYEYMIGLTKELNCTTVSAERLAAYERKAGKMAILISGTKDRTIVTVIIAVVLTTLLSSLVLAKKATWLI